MNIQEEAWNEPFMLWEGARRGLTDNKDHSLTTQHIYFKLNHLINISNFNKLFFIQNTKAEVVTSLV